MGGAVFICTDWKKKQSILYVANLEGLKYVRNQNMKCKTLCKIQNRQTAGHV
jgi:hypothetical protein